MARICIVTPGQLGSNPRVVKEASALSGAGHQVTVICTKVADFVESRDQAVMATASFAVRRLAFDKPARWRLARVLQFAARWLWHTGVWPGCRDRAISAMVPRLTRATCSQPADLYIAHYPPALPAVARAAGRHGARYAFDAEDFHSGDWPETAEFEAERRLVGEIESRHLPGAAYSTAASPLIAQAYSDTYAIGLPTVVLNTFPALKGSGKPEPDLDARPGPSIYWFSQTIGPGRGLELAIEAVSLSVSRPHLYLRGTLAQSYRAELQLLAAHFGVLERLHFLDPVNPGELECAGASFDLGYVGEVAETRNRRIALTNKLFSYLSSGLPIVASDIPAHRDIASTFGPALQLFPLGNARNLAEAIDGLLDNRRQLAEAREHAWRLGQTRYSWEAEQAGLVAIVRKCLSSDCLDIALSEPLHSLSQT